MTLYVAALLVLVGSGLAALLASARPKVARDGAPLAVPWPDFGSVLQERMAPFTGDGSKDLALIWSGRMTLEEMTAAKRQSLRESLCGRGPLSPWPTIWKQLWLGVAPSGTGMVQSRFEPVTFDPRIVAVIEGAAARLGQPIKPMTSGAGQDAQMLARVCPTAMIFVPSIGGRSHVEVERTTWEDCEAGANVLLIEPGKHLGGLTSGGLGATDIGRRAALLEASLHSRVLVSGHRVRRFPVDTLTHPAIVGGNSTGGVYDRLDHGRTDLCPRRH